MKIFMIFVFCIVMAGCAGQHCIKVGGGYTYDDGQKIDGNLEYCYDNDASDANKTPVMKDAAGRRYILVGEEDVRAFLSASPSASSQPPADTRNVFAAFKSRIKESNPK